MGKRATVIDEGRVRDKFSRTIKNNYNKLKLAVCDCVRAAAAIVSCTNLGRLLPVVEQMGRAYCMSTWKLDPATLKFLLKVPNYRTHIFV